MDSEIHKDLNQELLREMFNSVAKSEIHNKEVAALMGEVNEANPEILPGGIRSEYGFTLTKVSRSKKKKKDQALIDLILKEDIRKALIRINEIIEYHQEQIEEFLRKLEQTQLILEKLDEQHQMLKAELNYFQENGFFDLEENGQLKNAKVEEILSAWESKNNKSIDRNNPGSFELMLNILLEIEKQRIELKENIDNYTVQFEHHKIKLDEALQIKKDMESGDTEKQLNALVKYDQVFKDFDVKGGLRSVQKPNVKDVGKIIEDEFLSAFPSMQEVFSKAVSSDGKTEKENSPKSINNQTNPPTPKG